MNKFEAVFDLGPGLFGPINGSLHTSTLASKKEVERKRTERGFSTLADYPYRKVELAISEALKSQGLPTDISLVFVDRQKFGADLSFTIRSLLQSSGGPGGYIKEHLPKLLQAIEQSSLKTSGVIEKIETKGIYINIRLTDTFLFNSIESVFQLKSLFG